VVVTCGAQQALQLAVRSLVKPGDRVFVDSPTYPGLLAILRQVGAVPVALRCDAEGVLPGDLTRAIDEYGACMLATCSIVSNPEASVLSPQRREALLEIITRHDVVVLEDLTLAETVLDDVPAGAPLTADPRVRGITVGSASKLLWGGLRVGWLRTSETWLRRLAQAKALEDFGTSPITQRITASLMRRLDEQPEWLGHRRAELRSRRDLMVDLLHEHLPTWGVRAPVGGLSLWVRVPSVDTTHFAGVADRYGVHVMPGERCGTGDGYTDHLRICFDRDPEVLREAVTRLARAQHDLARMPVRMPVTVGP
jgi:DNA-binding transcriptional MocR family regulator